jgi:hypothetical protein
VQYIHGGLSLNSPVLVLFLSCRLYDTREKGLIDEFVDDVLELVELEPNRDALVRRDTGLATRHDLFLASLQDGCWLFSLTLPSPVAVPAQRHWDARHLPAGSRSLSSGLLRLLLCPPRLGAPDGIKHSHYSCPVPSGQLTMMIMLNVAGRFCSTCCSIPPYKLSAGPVCLVWLLCCACRLACLASGVCLSSSASV